MIHSPASSQDNKKIVGILTPMKGLNKTEQGETMKKLMGEERGEEE